MRDFLPDRDRDAEDFIQQHFPVATPAPAGKAAAFWRFLHQEFTALFESEYRADPADRTSAGRPWGITFALYTLFRDPHIFHRYVIASSGPNFDDEANYAREHDRLPVRLHFVMEESDSEVAQLERFLDTLASRAYAGLKVSHQVLNCTHCAACSRVPSRIGSSVLLMHGLSGSGSGSLAWVLAGGAPHAPQHLRRRKPVVARTEF